MEQTRASQTGRERGKVTRVLSGFLGVIWKEIVTSLILPYRSLSRDRFRKLGSKPTSDPLTKLARLHSKDLTCFEFHENESNSAQTTDSDHIIVYINRKKSV